MANEKTHGLERKGAGRKSISDPKIGITIYVEESIVSAFGGVEMIKNECYKYLKNKTENIK